MSIDLIILDVDGTMTDGKNTLYPLMERKIKSFCVKRIGLA